MKVSEHTIAALGKLATGDNLKYEKFGIAPYQSGPELVSFFNQFGANDTYQWGGAPSRWKYAEEQLHSHNGKSSLKRIIEALLDPRRFLNTKFTQKGAVDYLNKIIRFDGYECVADELRTTVRELRGSTVPLSIESSSIDTLDHEYVAAQIGKCDDRISRGDYDGAVTNARTVVETVLCALERKLARDTPQYNGELQRLSKRVHTLMNLQLDRQDISDNLKAVLMGLMSIVNGLAPLRNKMSDAHPPVVQPLKHHAVLVVNAAKTYVHFIVDTYEYQLERGLIKPLE